MSPSPTSRTWIPLASRCALPALALALLALTTGCSGGSSRDPANRGPFLLRQITTGQGQIYPYRVRELDGDGRPSNRIINIESEATLRQHVNASNGVLPVATFPSDLSLPEGGQGNNYLLFKFSNNLDLDSILSDSIAAANTSSGLTTALNLLAYDPEEESTRVLRGRGFVGGATYVNRGGVMELVQAVTVENGQVAIQDPIADGFPRGFVDDVELVAPNVFVFVADSDGDLSTLESFDPLGENLLIQVRVTNAIRNTNGRVLQQEVCTATTVGADPNPGNVIGWSGFRTLEITPGNAQSNIDPLTDIFVHFNKPVQPPDVGTYLSGTNLTPALGGIALAVTVGASSYTIIYYADPVSYSDLCNYRITPAYSLPGEEQITVQVQASSIRTIKDNSLLGIDVATSFRTGNGPGIVNAPVSPDAIYVGIGGSQPGVAVIDLNGYGQTTNGLDPDPITGRPTKDPLDTYFARFNPNIGQPGLTPPLFPGSTTLDGGSNGPLTLVQDTRGNTTLLRAPTISQVADIQVGPPLDLVYNNSNINVNVNGANQTNPGTGLPAPGNCVAVSPHPNPPRLVYPPPNPSRAIFAEEPTDTRSGTSLLQPGTRPDFRPRAFAGFTGPAPAPPSPPPPPVYAPYQSRQQLGHFLYVLDRDNRQILVLNSNRFTILDTIRLSDPYDMAFSPSLGVMAVSNFSSSSVSIIDTNPQSTTFNQVISEARVAEGPTQIVWQPDGEAICVLCNNANALSVLKGDDFSLLKTVTGNIVDPIGLVVSERYLTTGNTSNVFYAYILNSNGTIAVYESGPDGTNGIGYNDIIGTVTTTFRRARAIKMDWTSGLGGFWISHVDDSGVAVVSRVELTVSPQGPLTTQQNTGNGFVLPPTFRQKEWTITERFGGIDPNQPVRLTLSGSTVSDFVFDEMLNGGATPNQITNYNSTGVGASFMGHSSKGKVLGGAVSPIQPAFLFVALSDVGKIDIIDVTARVKVGTIDVPGVQLLASYWRQ
ncbi:MAG: hypothetical protein IPM29_07480 [Planctomycetes bacterium]|nr:hypothetical protein [Planctomycetota bacterium]